MSFSTLKKAKLLRAMLNLGGIFDMVTATFYRDKNGQWHCCGGMPNFVGIAGMPNTFKTQLALFFMACILARYTSSKFWAHDSENTLTVQRILAAFTWFEELTDLDLEELDRFNFSDAETYMGEEWFEALKNISDLARDAKSTRLTTPFWDEKNQAYIKMPPPVASLLDSLSGFTTSVLEKQYDEHDIGDSKLNAIAMNTARIKSQMLEQMINVAGPGGIFSAMTVHIGQEYNMGGKNQPIIKRLKHLSGDLKIKKASENFAFYTGVTFQTLDWKKMLDGDRMPEFPRHKDDNLKDDTDMLEVPVKTLRNKFGPSGYQFSVAMSQSEGVKMGLTNYLFVKGFRKPDKDSVYYGIGGNDSHFFNQLLPDTKLTRKSLRAKLEEDSRLDRAMEVIAQMAYMEHMWHELEEGWLCSPTELYESLKSKGYDWDILLNTRSYWIFQEETNPLHELTVPDLLDMRAGRYHPEWYPKTLKDMGLPPLTESPYSMISSVPVLRKKEVAQ